METKIKDGRCKIDNAIKKKVILYFKNYKNNSSPAIAKHYGINVKTVDRILNQHIEKQKEKFLKRKK
jgi:hypothetical protein